ncbi:MULTISPECIES: toxin co-regulated pilus biosynthesis Q family protein [unclassified Paraburkholderia]|uniref:toxin co-regulated pilus biosynthesis Q family protein n=1 Tax=unclassified Paraburkholderia TaxID=2615204 RepID=UPI002AAF87B7|nr:MULTISPECIES: toxin co-regulated pilus biosynthesis Q family protein [unclassified Paraburkholderia]
MEQFRLRVRAASVCALMLYAGSSSIAFANDGSGASAGGWQPLDGSAVAAADTFAQASDPARSLTSNNVSSTPQADFDGGSNSIPRRASAVTQTGVRPNNVHTVKGHGRKVVLSRMMRAVLPRGFTVDYGDVPSTRTVSWTGGSAWDLVLADSIDALGDVSVDIDWDKRHVTLAHIDALATESVSTTPTISGDDYASGAPITFTLVSGESLERQLAGWAKRAGWTVTWNTPEDWIVPHASSFGSDFQQAITEVINQMESNGADVRGDIWTGNHTVVIDRAGVN